VTRIEPVASPPEAAAQEQTARTGTQTVTGQVLTGGPWRREAQLLLLLEERVEDDDLDNLCLMAELEIPEGTSRKARAGLLVRECSRRRAEGWLDWLGGEIERRLSLARASTIQEATPLHLVKDLEVEVFISYSHKDSIYRQELVKHLQGLVWEKVLKSAWHDQEILAGDEWEKEVEEHLRTAQVIILLVSPDFIASKYCREKELELAMARHDNGEARIVPVIVRPAYWKSTPLGRFQALPPEGKAISVSPDMDEAFVAVVEGIRDQVKQLER
jgi:hypothetical protein